MMAKDSTVEWIGPGRAMVQRPGQKPEEVKTPREVERPDRKCRVTLNPTVQVNVDYSVELGPEDVDLVKSVVDKLAKAGWSNFDDVGSAGEQVGEELSHNFGELLEGIEEVDIDCRPIGGNSPVRELPRYGIRGKTYFRDERLGEYRNVLNPHDRITFDEFERRGMELETPSRR